MPFPLVIPASVSTPTSMPTLADGRHALADQLGAYLRTIVSSTSPNGESGRWVLLDELRDDEAGRAAFAGGYVYAVTGAQAGKSRRVRSEGFEGHYAALGLARPFPAALAPGVTVEVTNPLPVIRTGVVKGLNDLWNEGLDRTTIEVRLALTGNGTRIISLASYGAIMQAGRVDGIYYWPNGQSSTLPPCRLTVDPVVTTNGGVFTLDPGYTFSEDVPFQVRILVQASRYVYDGSAWGFSTTGLTADTHQAAAPVEWVLPVAMVKALQYLTRLTVADRVMPKDEKRERIDELMQQRRVWAKAAADVIRDVMPHPEAKASQGLIGGVSHDLTTVDAFWGGVPSWP